MDGKLVDAAQKMARAFKDAQEEHNICIVAHEHQKKQAQRLKANTGLGYLRVGATETPSPAYKDYQEKLRASIWLNLSWLNHSRVARGMVSGRCDPRDADERGTHGDDVCNVQGAHGILRGGAAAQVPAPGDDRRDSDTGQNVEATSEHLPCHTLADELGWRNAK